MPMIVDTRANRQYISCPINVSSSLAKLTFPLRSVRKSLLDNWPSDVLFEQWIQQQLAQSFPPALSVMCSQSPKLLLCDSFAWSDLQDQHCRQLIFSHRGQKLRWISMTCSVFTRNSEVRLTSLNQTHIHAVSKSPPISSFSCRVFVYIIKHVPSSIRSNGNEGSLSDACPQKTTPTNCQPVPLHYRHANICWEETNTHVFNQRRSA